MTPARGGRVRVAAVLPDLDYAAGVEFRGGSDTLAVATDLGRVALLRRGSSALSALTAGSEDPLTAIRHAPGLRRIVTTGYDGSASSRTPTGHTGAGSRTTGSSCSTPRSIRPVIAWRRSTARARCGSGVRPAAAS